MGVMMSLLVTMKKGNNVDAQGCDYAEDNFDCDEAFY